MGVKKATDYLKLIAWLLLSLTIEGLFLGAVGEFQSGEYRSRAYKPTIAGAVERSTRF